MSRAIDAAGDVFYGMLRLLLGTAVRIYYRRIEVGHPERVPARGPLLIVANHPASLTDVLALGAALRRRLHFVAYSGLFQNPVLGSVLRLAGAVPVYRREDAAELMHRNEEMFAACNRLIAGGRAVLVFPEGTSASDRRVEKLKTGAARMALAYEFADGRAGGLTLLPIGLHFTERTAFRSDLVLTVGPPIELGDLRETSREDPARAVRELTGRIQAALETLILNVPSTEIAGLVRDIQQLYMEDLREQAPGTPDLSLLQRIADSVEFFSRYDPERLHRIWNDVTTYRRKLSALGLRDQALRDIGAAGAGAPRLVTAFLLGLPIALAGALVNWLPYRGSSYVGRLLAGDPTRLAFGRMMCGVVLFPLTYAALALALRRGAGWRIESIALVLTACVPLGLFSLRFFGWLKRERHRLHTLFLFWSDRRIVARLHAERRRLVRMLDAAREDYLEGLAAAEEGSGPA